MAFPPILSEAFRELKRPFRATRPPIPCCRVSEGRATYASGILRVNTEPKILPDASQLLAFFEKIDVEFNLKKN